METKYMMIDDIPVEINGEKNVLELIRKVGIELPTFCYYSDLSVYGACRMCVVENKRGDIDASCSMVPQQGMEVYTNTARLRKYRKSILELLLANHCRDCTSCDKNGNCRLQGLAERFGINRVRFENTAVDDTYDTSSPCITRGHGKCILCGDCVRMCNEVQNVGALDFIGRGSEMQVGTAFNEPLSESPCVGCGQCAAVCPTGAIVVRRDTDEVWNALSDPNTKVIVQIAPAVRVGIGKDLGLAPGENSMGKIVAALRRMGFNEIFDTSTGADLTVIEETNEFIDRFKSGKLPLFTSCCPAWYQYAEKRHPDLMDNISTCRSPMQMFGSVIKEQFASSEKKIVSVAVMPCTAKKFEAGRPEFTRDNTPVIDYVITTQELIRMIKESGIVFDVLEPESVDMPFGMRSGAGIIFGVTGGVTEAVIRRISDDKSNAALRTIAFVGVRGMEGVKEATVPFNGGELKIAIVSGLGNAESLIQKIKNGEASYDFIEVMACPGGCICGAGQPFIIPEERTKRSAGIYEIDRLSSIKRSEENPIVLSLYNGLLKGKVHELLHVPNTNSN